jgi:hypothetical protein
MRANRAPNDVSGGDAGVEGDHEPDGEHEEQREREGLEHVGQLGKTQNQPLLYKIRDSPPRALRCLFDKLQQGVTPAPQWIAMQETCAALHRMSIFAPSRD